MSVICTQSRIHRTQSLHYDKLLKQGSLRYIVTTNFAARIYHGDISFRFARFRCSKFSLDRYLGEISRRLYRYLADLSFANPCDLSQIYQREIADISARNNANKARYSSIIVCITFAQYCTLKLEFQLYFRFLFSQYFGKQNCNWHFCFLISRSRKTLKTEFEPRFSFPCCFT